MAFIKEKIDELDAGISFNYSLTKEGRIVDYPPFANIPKPKKDGKPNYEGNAVPNAPNRDKPTTADAKKGLKDLPAAMAAVDPQGLSSIAPKMYQMLGQIAAAAGGASESTRKQTVEDALSGALAILSNKYTFEYLTLVFNNALKNNGIDLIDTGYQSVVKNALANLYKNYLIYGEGNIPETTYETVTTIGVEPTPLVTNVPDLYVQQYYTKENDPYPGYIEWISQDRSTSVYTERTIGDPYYSSPGEEVYSESETQLAVDLEPYVIENNLTAKILNDLLVNQETQVENSTAEKTGGKNSSKQLMSVLMQLAGYAGKIANLQQSLQLPISVLNQGGIKKSHESFMKNIGQLRQAKDKAREAAKPLSAAAGLLSSVGAISEAVGAVSGAVGAVSGAVGAVSGAVGAVSGAVGAVSGAVGAVSSISSVSSAVSAAQTVVNSTEHVKSLYNTITS
jgi:hypothetical protein